MYEYIKRTDAIKEINRGDLLVGNCAEWAEEIIWRTPYADVAEVKHAHWIEKIRFFNTTYVCSNCSAGSARKSLFCADCGAKMDGEYWYEGIY